MTGAGDLTGTTAIVTGGGSGMGREICLELAGRGAAVVVSSNVEEQIDAVAGACRQAGGTAMAITADVTDDAQVEALVSGAVAEYGAVDVLFNNAGIGQHVIAPDPARRRFQDLDIDRWNRLMDVNVAGVVRTMLAVIPVMEAAGGGSIVNLTSGTVRFPVAGISAYTTSKFAVEGITKVAALDLEAARIRVNCLQPGGPVDTALIPDDYPPAAREALHRPSVIRSCAAWLASSESQMMTGRSFVAVEWNKERAIVDCPCNRCTTIDTRLAPEWRGIAAL